ncbi:MAG TPA: MazG family protein [Beutenbergiaceae bacterium]|nr:MazG family protein [Beutenbergiaceae bacterium]
MTTDATADSADSGPPGARLLAAVALMDRLRSPGGCPWDAEQTHQSLVPYAIEEAYEVAEAAESGDPDQLRDELGDLLLQVLFHARIATESPGGFDIDDVAEALIAKLTFRHPHVFADDGEPGLSADEVTDQWERRKSAERSRDSILEGIPVALPALARASKMLGRIERSGLDVDPDPLTQPGSSSAQPDPGGDPTEMIGRQLLHLVAAAGAAGVDPEAALRDQLRRLTDVVHAAERTAEPPGRQVGDGAHSSSQRPPR